MQDLVITMRMLLIILVLHLIKEIISATHVAESFPVLKELIDNDSFLSDASLLDICNYHANTNKNKKNAPNENNNDYKSIRLNAKLRRYCPSHTEYQQYL